MARRASKSAAKWDNLRLDVGCGENKNEGFIGMDKVRLKGVDVVHDAHDLPWPFPDSCAQLVALSNVIQYLDPKSIFEVTDEIWRILKPRGSLIIAAPYAGAFQTVRDPLVTHAGYNEDTPYYWDATRRTDTGEYLYDAYQPRPYKVAEVEYRLSNYINWIMKPMKRADGRPQPIRIPPRKE
jgi:SAM-dependent methyltransferase